jgi:chromosome segregation ATPase
MSEYVREYHAERERLAANASTERQKLERRLIAIDREADRVTDMLVKGVGSIERLDARAKELDREEKEVRAALEAIPEAVHAVKLHPAALRRYEEQLQRLGAALNDGIREGDSDGAEALRDLVETVTVCRRDPGKTEVEIAGRLTALLGGPALPSGIQLCADRW